MEKTALTSRRFVVLRHEMPVASTRASHWDFMVEADGSLRTWAIEQEPVAGQTIAAVALSDHRLAYLEYEGAVSGDRGSVTRWDQGLCRAVCWHDSRLELEMSGTRLQGTVSLARDSGADHWTFRFSPGNVATPV